MSSTISAVKEESNNCRDIEVAHNLCPSTNRDSYCSVSYVATYDTMHQFEFFQIIQIISRVVASATLLIACKAGP
jgi:hypothetical protein